MKAVNILLVGLAVLALAGLGLAGLALAVDPSGLVRIKEWTNGMEDALAQAGAFRPVLGVAAGLLVAGAVGVVWGNLSQRRYERIVLLRTPLGEVLISLNALEDLGRLVKNEVAGLKDIKLRVTASRRGLRADARVVLQGDVDVAQVSEAVQAAVRRRLQQVVGLEQDIRPRVMVSKVAPGGGEADELEARPRLRRLPRP